MRRNFLAAAALVVAALTCRAEEKKDANVVKVDPEEFAVEVKKDEKAAAARYKGKTIEMTAPVAGVNRNASGDVFLSLPDNIQETFGLVVVEAMASGLPVLGSDWDGYRDLVVHGETGFLVPTRMVRGATTRD